MSWFSTWVRVICTGRSERDVRVCIAQLTIGFAGPCVGQPLNQIFPGGPTTVAAERFPPHPEELSVSVLSNATTHSI